MNKAKHYLRTANKAPCPPQSDTTLPRHRQSRASLGLRARLCPAPGSCPCWIPISLSTKGACRAPIPSGDAPVLPPQTAAPNHQGAGINHPEEPSVQHQLKPNLLARCCPRSGEEQEPGWGSWEGSHPTTEVHAQDSPSSSSSSFPQGVCSPQNSPHIGLVRQKSKTPNKF